MILDIKTLTKKQKIIMYASAVIIAIIAAIAMVILFIHLLKNPPEVILNSSNSTKLSASSAFDSLLSSDVSELPDENNNLNAPKINGVKNGTIYYTTQYVTVSDDNLKSVTLNGVECEKKFFIDGNQTNMYIIEAIDHDDNITSFIVYTKEISTLLEPINHLNTNTVTDNDSDTLNNIKQTVSDLNTKYASNYEAEEITNAIDTCNKYLNKIKAIKKQISDIEKTVKNHDMTNDLTGIGNTINNIDALLCSQNLTDEQRSTLTQLNSRCQQLLNFFPGTDQIEQNIE